MFKINLKLNSSLHFLVQFAIFGLPILWALGFHVNDAARILGLILAVSLFFCEGPQSKNILVLNVVQKQILHLFLLFFSIYLVSEPWLSVYIGQQSDDFVVFTQVVDSINRKGLPVTTWIKGSPHWTNFIWHHFAPFLYLPAFVSSFDISAFGALSLTHAAGVIFGFLTFYLTSNIYFSRSQSLIFTALLASNPTIRHGLYFGVHDEIFALPFLGLAFWSWQTNRLTLMSIALLGAATTKESLSLVGIFFIGMVFFDFKGTGHSNSSFSQNIGVRNIFVLAISGLILLAVFISYFFLQPYFSGKSFDHFSKLMTWKEIANLDFLFGKLYFASFIAFPCFTFFYFKPIKWHLLMPLIPLIAIISASRFAEMWKPMNYYGVLPTFILMFGVIISASKNPKHVHFLSMPLPIGILFCCAFSFSGKKPMHTILTAVKKPWLRESDLQMIPSTSKIIGSKSAALMLLRSDIVYRIDDSEQVPWNTFDLVVLLPSEKLELSDPLKKNLEDCSENEKWLVYCKQDSPLLKTPHHLMR